MPYFSPVLAAPSLAVDFYPLDRLFIALLLNLDASFIFPTYNGITSQRVASLSKDKIDQLVKPLLDVSLTSTRTNVSRLLTALRISVPCMVCQFSEDPVTARPIINAYSTHWSRLLPT